MAQNSSRLHRLLTLLDTGSTQATRFAAARQIGDIAKSHPQDLSSLLKKVSQYLRSRNWDTRVAAAHAVGAIAENVKHTSLEELFASVEAEMLVAGFSDVSNGAGMSWSNFQPNDVAGLSFRSFDINKVLEFGSPLLASGGQEYDVASDGSKNPAERLARQKQNLRRRLGLDVCEQFMDVSDVIKDEDLLAQKGYLSGNGSYRGYHASQSGQNIQQLVATMVPSFRPKRLSARELNLLKRKAKINAKDHTKCLSEDDELEVPYSQNTVMPTGTCSDPLGACKDSTDSPADEDNSEHGENGKWPFQQFVEQLVHDMFDPVWEVRHGTIMALREILTYQGAYAGVYFPDLSLMKSCLVDLDDKSFLNSIKRAREIDLNIQFTVDEYEPDLKRHKSNCEESVLSNNRIGYLNKEMNNGAYGNMEGGLVDATPVCVNGNLHIAPLKVEPDLCTDGLNSQVKEEDMSSLRSFFEDNSSILNVNVLANHAESSKLVKLIKLARHSWVKNWEFLQDCAIRFLCVLSLDRFGDYVSDQVVAPVRETCAQALGAVLKYMHPSLVHETLKILLQMQCRQEWEIRHGSLLGIKYLVAVRREMLQDLLFYVLPACRAGLEDPDDDVRAVAAEALIPAAAAIVSLDDKILHSIVMLLWDILLDLDDLSPSTSSVMNLLAEIYSQPEMVPKMLDTLTLVEKQEFDLNEASQAEEHGNATKLMDNPYILSTLTPRLWPFMRHSITSVRHSAIRTLERLLEVGYTRSSCESMATRFWPASVLGDALRIVFQNLLLESNDDILQSSERVWRLLLQCPEQDLEASAKAYFASWMQLATTPCGSYLDSTKMFWPVVLPRKSRSRAAAKMRAVKLENESDKTSAGDSAKEYNLQEKNLDVPANITKIIVNADGEKSVTHTRVVTATALGIFASKLPATSLHVVVDTLWSDLTSFSGVQRQVASMVLVAWFKELQSRDPAESRKILLGILNDLKQWLLDLLACSDPAFPTKDSVLPYAELSRSYAKMRNEARLLFRSIDSSGAFKDLRSSINFNVDTLSVDEAVNFVSKLSLPVDSTGAGTIEKHLLDDIESLKQRVLATSGYLKCVQNNLHVTVSALVAAAVVWMSELPTRLNPVILPLMAAVKREQEEILQQKAAEALAELIFHCIGRKPCPNDKLIKNLCSLTCADSCETPQAALINSMEVIEDHNLLSFGKAASGQRAKLQVLPAAEDRSKVEGFISRRGSEMALKHLCQKFGSSLFDKLPKLWECLTEVLKPLSSEIHLLTDEQKMLKMIDFCKDKDPQILINNIQVVRSVAPMVDESLRPQLLTLLPCILGCIRHYHVAVRLAASRCITSMAKSMTVSVMGAVIEKVIPMLSDTTSVHARQGAGMLVSLLVQGLGVELVPYAPLLVVPLLRCMSDCDHAVRQSVTHSFAVLVPLLPLARGLPAPVGLSESLSRSTEDAQFLEQLLDNSHIDDYKLSVDLKVSLRRYQQEGINWLSFLRRFKLHGILCDDMGLGKTLQASAIVASDIAERRACGNGKDLQSLIICPSTLVGHWAYEIEKYVDDSVMVTLQYVGSAQERMSLHSQFDRCNVIITSYDIVRKDVGYLGILSWNYCILDEGHIIKNSKSKITAAVKQLKAEHRLILSGTPIQNNVLELWSLFDFLMPGFLGTEKQFQATYGKPLLAAKDSKCSAKDAEAGVLAMEALHKQVMPFLLRRTKDEVLSDLPEKIIQDRYCDLSPVQLKLYEQFSCSNAKQEMSTLVKAHENTSTAEETATKTTSHVFQALKYLLKLCSHPLLVIGEKPPDYLSSLLSEVIPDCADILTELHKLHHSPKLVALQEILEECGIGLDTSGSDGAVTIGQHRVLIFAQHKSLLDIIERDLFLAHMKSITYLRLDGSVEPEKRFEIVKAFNSDPTIDVLLLTTHVGGLGLNLTSADTLVFMEHDWNPMKDHQAMDRAHRLGQRKVVNVHRLIMRGTLEEKVMSLQKFKVSLANAVINAENASLKTMNTDQLLDLFTSASTARQGTTALSSSSNGDLNKDSKSMVGGKGLKAVLSGLEDLWDQSQYADEYNLSHFLAKLNG
ncbi:TATA-binding protein-associated factor BTAF1 isoform X2 [Elaeis guineensis]|uniref:TATA-binding protein-associated factor BTAF1 isoform X1 n=2 Tax=Elaeis guineensis var. tenera TaxID=51953 RepID=A0A6I9RJE1_ELAGV|nr:TATA-binding protein-associated factor BTAF1 isoform X1 [Elaeis guineensis]